MEEILSRGPNEQRWWTKAAGIHKRDWVMASKTDKKSFLHHVTLRTCERVETAAKLSCRYCAVS